MILHCHLISVFIVVQSWISSIQSVLPLNKYFVDSRV